MVTSPEKVARLQGIGVLVGVWTVVLVGLGVNVEVGTIGLLVVGEASKATRVNSAATVCAAWVKMASGACWVAVPPVPGRLHAAVSIANKTEPKSDFFIESLFLTDILMIITSEVNRKDAISPQ